MYGIINVLYLKADKDMNGMISEPELADVYHGFDTNGQICLHCKFEYVRGLFISRYLNKWCVRCAMFSIEISLEIQNYGNNQKSNTSTHNYFTNRVHCVQVYSWIWR